MRKLENGNILLTTDDQRVIKELIQNISIRQNWGTVERSNGVPITIIYLDLILSIITGKIKEDE